MTMDMRIIRLAAQPTLDNLAVSRAPVPTPGPDEVLLRLRASSLNFHDYLVVAGYIPVAEGRVPLSDGAGEIAALGSDVSGWSVGDRVMGAFFPLWIDGAPNRANNAKISGETADGFAADYVVVPANSLTAIPEGWSFAEAATLPCAALTAWRVLVEEGQLRPGDSVLLPGSGGLCLFALQIAKARGLTVYSTTSSDAKMERLRAMGADHVVNYREDRTWGETIRRLTDGEGVDLVLEVGGQSSFVQSVRATRMGGQVIVVGTTANGAPELPLSDVVMRHIHVDGIAVGSVGQLGDLVRFLEEKSIRPVIDRTFAFERLADAFRAQLTGAHFGKIVIAF
jgi:NADPH:quinone reductase-like Zn-dependent oxidoreductase